MEDEEVKLRLAELEKLLEDEWTKRKERWVEGEWWCTLL